MLNKKNIKLFLDKIQNKSQNYNFEENIDIFLDEYYNEFNNISNLYEEVYTKTKINKITKTNNYNSKFKQIYPKSTDILKAIDKHFDNYNDRVKFIYELSKYPNDYPNLKKIIERKFPECILFNDKYNFYYNFFMDDEIENNIHKTVNCLININYSYPELGIHNEEILLYLDKSNALKYNSKYIKLILTRIILFNKITASYNNNKNIKNVPNFKLFILPLKKEIMSGVGNDNIYKSYNINSAVTDTNTNIIIYREEELLKSILHESIHYHNLDFKFFDYPINLINELKGIEYYNLDSSNKLRISEAYTDFMACILNIILTIKEKNIASNNLYKKKKITIKNKNAKFINNKIKNNKVKSNKIKAINKRNSKANIDIKKMKQLLLYEIKFSAFQCYKVLNFSKQLGIKHKQESYPFSYYIIKFQLLINSKKIFDMINSNFDRYNNNNNNKNNNNNNNNNNNILNLKFNLTFQELQNMIAFTSNSNQESNIQFKNIMENIASIKFNKEKDKKMLKTMRMSITDLLI